MNLITDLKDKRLRKHECGDDCCDEHLMLNSLRAVLEREGKKDRQLCRARAALERYGHHDPGKCAASKHSGWICDCGFDEALSYACTCPHEEENKELREIILDAGIHDSSCKVDDGDECSCYLVKLRRRAGLDK